MLRSAPRAIARQSAQRIPRPAPARRFLSTAPPAQQRRSWKSLVGRLGLAGAVVYYYNTTDVFADEPRHRVPADAVAADSLPTLDSIAAERAQRRAVRQQLELRRQQEVEAEALLQQQQQQSPDLQAQQSSDLQTQQQQQSPADLQAEADQQGAFNPETGEINWDCPCLGGMASGPCGDEFKAAFSCFVFSKEEPKGLDCIEKFKDMQGCFRQYPEIYGAEIDNDDDDEDDVTASAPALSGESAQSPAPPATKTTGPHSADKLAENRRELGLVPENYRPEESVASQDKPSDTLVPAAAHDGR